MKTATVRSGWLPKGGFRLDCSPYLGGAIETEILLEQLSVRKDRLGEVTAAIYNGPKFSRTYVDDPEFGVPFLGGSALQQADLSNLPLLSKQQAHGAQLRHLEIKRGMTLITCSGTIGKMAYARPEMEGIWSSQHVMKIVPDEAKIPSGYLYAFLSSKFGVPLVVSGTYGSIIQSIEAHHIAGLSVPRFGDALEHEIHELVEEAARLRSEASRDFQQAIVRYHETCGLADFDPLDQSDGVSSLVVHSDRLSGRFDANFHRPTHYAALEPFLSGRLTSISVREFASTIVEPSRFKRVQIDDPSGVDFFGTGTLGDADPAPIYQIASGDWVDSYRVNLNTLLIPRSGQIYGIIGTAYQPIGRVLNAAVTEDAIRVTCEDAAAAGYLYLALRSPYGLFQLKARCFGGSIPHLDVANIGSVVVPRIKKSDVTHLGMLAVNVAKKRTAAIEAEAKAETLLANAIQNT